MSRVLKVAGTKCREFFLATFATLSTVFFSFGLFRDIKYPRLLDMRFLATFNTRDFFYSRHFHFSSKKSSRLLICCKILVKIGPKLRKIEVCIAAFATLSTRDFQTFTTSRHLVPATFKTTFSRDIRYLLVPSSRDLSRDFRYIFYH